MTVYTTDFSEYTIGNALSDWTDFWGTSAFTFLAQANSGDFKVGTKECNYLVSGDDRSVLTWDDIGDVADSDIIAKVNVNSLIAGAGVRLYSRVSGTSGSENAYMVLMQSDSLNLFKYVAGVSSNIGTGKIFTYKVDTNYWIRFQTIGTIVRTKIWAEDAIEPGEWKISYSDFSLSSGAVGFGGYDASVDYEVDYFSCGTIADSAVFPPSGYELLDTFGFVGESGVESYLDTARAMGGEFVLADKKLVGVRLACHDHSDQVRVGVYSGGDLATGLNGATLLYDFGLTTGSATGDVELSCSAVAIPQNEPLWIVLKGDNAAGFGYAVASAAPMNSGNYQLAKGRCDVTAIIGNDPDVVFPATFPSTSGTFAAHWYDWDILLETSGTSSSSTTTTTTIDLSGNQPINFVMIV